MNPRYLVQLAVMGADLWMMSPAIGAEAASPENPPAPGAVALPRIDDVFQLLEDNRFAEAAPLLQRLADSGDARARFFRGLTFLTGAGVKVDWDAGRAELRQAAASGDRLAALFLLQFAGKDATKEERNAWLTVAQRVPGKHEWVPTTLGFVEGVSAPELNRLSAVQWNRTQAAAGDAVACYNLSRYYRAGFGVAPSQTEYRRWLDKAGEAGFAPALEEMALNAFLGLYGETEDRARGAALELRAAEAGDADAQFSVAESFLEGRWGRTTDAAEAVKWLEKAAAQDHVKALAKLGNLLRDGSGVAHDDERAVALYERAAKLGNRDAQGNLGWMNEIGRGVTKDPLRAAEWYRKAGERGNVWAIKALGTLYRDGAGVPQDLAKARELYERAAAAGNASAMYSLGWLYSEGKGVPKDQAKAFEWFEKAARDGDADAQNTVGWNLLNGIGIERDPQESITWFKLAAEKGSERAMFNLVDLYRKEIGGRVPHDEVARWQLKLAELRGLPLRIEFLRDEVYGQPDPAKAAAALAELRSIAKGDDAKVAPQARAALANALLGSLHPELRSAAETLKIAVDLHETHHSAGTFVLAKLLYAGAKDVPIDVPTALRLFGQLGESHGSEAMYNAAIELYDHPHEEGTRERARALMADAAAAGYEPASRFFEGRNRIGVYFFEQSPPEAELRRRVLALGSRGTDAEAVAVFAPRPILDPIAATDFPSASATLELFVDPDGSVAEVNVSECSHNAYRDAATAAAKRWRFAAASRGGTPVPSRVKITLNCGPTLSQ